MPWWFAAAALLLAALAIESGLLAYAAYVLLGVLALSRWLAAGWIDSLTAVRSVKAGGVDAPEDGIVGDYKGSNAREVKYSPEQWAAFKDGGEG